MQTDSLNMGELDSIKLSFKVGPTAHARYVTVIVDLTGVRFETQGDFWLLGSDLQLIAKCQHVLKHQDEPWENSK